ncbi:hypothetical protein G6F35_002156 [Rhizopus arrhizus]|nr:hypothetical protein G6F35_002156 [Rhizopus arrhizus]
MNNHHKRKAFSLLSLNGNSLFKVSNPTSRKHLIRYIRSKSPTFVALQEIDNSGSNGIHLQTLHRQFCSQQSLWTQYCGLLCFEPHYSLTRIPLPDDSRCILAQVTHVNGQMAPFHILVVYAPASSNRARHEFFNTLLTFRQLSPYDPISCVDRMIIAGDFNYSLQSSSTAHRSNPPTQWLHFLQCHFQNVMTDLRSLETATFRRGATTHSTIDYIYLSLDMSINYVDADVEFLNSEWTDHALLQVTLKAVLLFETGPGLWRANPVYTKIKEYRQKLASMLTQLYDQEIASSELSPQDLWDMVKTRVKQFTRRFGRQHVDWRKQQIVALQRKRQRLLRGSFPTSLLAIHLPRVEQQIQTLQQEITSIAILKAERSWRERGETDAGYLKKSATSRLVQRSIPRLMNPDTQIICSSQDQMLEVTERFYTELYSADPICSASLDNMVSHIPASCRLSNDDSDLMTSPFLLDEVLAQVKRTPKISSPGTDGLSYVFLNLIFQHPKYSELILRVFNDALSGSLFPKSWLETCICLLPKKGDLSLLKNWRPITLINCDAKIFTRLLNSRLVLVTSPLISPWQSGFMKERFIADNGALVNLAIEQASIRNSDEVGLLCDQEKAYDRIHPDYLQAVLVQFGFPENFVLAITSLFYGTSMQVNVNGHLTLPIPLGRGLRQGDPISPILFNLALEPLIRAIIHSPRIQGFQPPSLSLPNIRDPLHGPSSLQPLKVLAYADDLLIFLRNATDLDEVQRLIQHYNQASNAKMNYDKTIAFSISGIPHPHWLSALASHGITQWHDRCSGEPLTYLGYPLMLSTAHHRLFQDRLIAKITRACDIHKLRNLSVRGRATVLNTLILSTLWHVLRVSWISLHTLKVIRRICREFILFRVFPPISFDVLQLPLKKGGLGILDPSYQQQALQFRWLTPLIQHHHPSTVVSQCMAAHLASLAPVVLYDHRLPFLFPTLRRGLLQQNRPSLCALLFRAFDTLFDSATVSSALNSTSEQPAAIPLIYSLSLPLSAVVQWTSEFSMQEQKSFDTVLVQDAFEHVVELSCLRPKTLPSDRPNITVGRNRVKKLLRWIISGKITLAPFFTKLCFPSFPASEQRLQGSGALDSFCNSLIADGLDVGSEMITPKYFRITHQTKLLQSIPVRSPIHTKPAVLWQLFWKLKIPLAVRTPWYRLLQDKFPCAATIHKVLPDLGNSSCRLCTPRLITEYVDHFFFLCPPKRLVWEQIWPHFFGHTMTTHEVYRTIHLLCFPPQRLSLISNESIIACTILGIWKAHWRFIFDDVPFDPLVVFQNILSLVGPFRSDSLSSLI